MHFSRVKIAGVSAVDAPEIVTSLELESAFSETLKRLGHRAGFIEMLTGVKARRFWGPTTRPSDAATLAAEAVLKKTGIDPASVDLLINTSVSKDFIEPSIASIVHANLGLSSTCLNFDVSNACLAFLNAMTIAGNMIERGQIEVALIVDGEDSRLPVESTLRRLADRNATSQMLRENLATLTIGSGAAAMLLVRGSLNDALPSLVGAITRSATQHNRLCYGNPDQMTTDSGALLNAGMELIEETISATQIELGWDISGIDEVVMHQVSSVHAKNFMKRLDLPATHAHLIFQDYGNIGPAAIPITLAKSHALGRLQNDDFVALTGIGSGLNCTMMEVRWDGE